MLQKAADEQGGCQAEGGSDGAHQHRDGAGVGRPVPDGRHPDCQR